MTRNDTDEMAGLDQLLEEARGSVPDVPLHLMERVTADGMRLQGAFMKPPREDSLGRRFLDAIGGWPTLGGLAAASCAGFWIGVSPPDGLVDPATLMFGTTVGDYEEAIEMSGFGWDIQEG